MFLYLPKPNSSVRLTFQKRREGRQVNSYQNGFCQPSILKVKVVADSCGVFQLKLPTAFPAFRKCPWAGGREFFPCSPWGVNHLHADSQMTSCHVLCSSRAGGRMFNLLIYGFGTTLEKMTHVRSPSLPAQVALDCGAPECSVLTAGPSRSLGLLFSASTYQTFPRSRGCSWRRACALLGTETAPGWLRAMCPHLRWPSLHAEPWAPAGSSCHSCLWGAHSQCKRRKLSPTFGGHEMCA